MKKANNRKFLSFLFFSLFVWFFSDPVFAGEITIVGEVNDTHQIVAGGQIYEVANTAKGDDLVFNYIAVKVQVTGTVQEKEDQKIITVTSFKAVPE